MTAQRSIVIGGAFAGLALAVALRQGSALRFRSWWPIGAAGGQAAIHARPRSWPHCRRLFDAIGVWDAGRGQGAADPRHGGDRFQTGRCHPAGVSDLRRDVEPGEPFAHMIENRHLIDAWCYVPKPKASICVPPRDGIRHAEVASSDAERWLQYCGKPASGRRRRPLKTARTRRHCHPWLGLRSIRHRRHRRHEPRSSGRPRTFSSRRSVCDPALTGLRSSWCGPKARRGGRIIALDEGEFHAELEKRFGLQLARSGRSTNRGRFRWAISSRVPLSANGCAGRRRLRM